MILKSSREIQNLSEELEMDIGIYQCYQGTLTLCFISQVENCKLDVTGWLSILVQDYQTMAYGPNLVHHLLCK